MIRPVLSSCSLLSYGRDVVLSVAAVICLGGIVSAEQPAEAKKSAPAKPAVTAPVDSVLRRATEIVVKHVADGDLQGAWLQIDGRGGTYDVVPLLDKSQVEKQVAAVERVFAEIKEQNSSAKFTLREPELRPVTELIASLQHELEASMDFPGVNITAAVFTIQDQASENLDVVMSLQGRISTEKQREEIRKFGVALMAKHTFWGRRQPGQAKAREYERAYVDLSQLKKLRQSALFSSRMFSRGMQLFRNGDVDAAREHFRASMVESSDAVTRHYWLILCELQLGKTDRARNLLRVPLNRIRDGKLSYDVVLRSLERVQGPLRWKLIAMENSILLKAK
jgi:hypothetical protein